MIPTTPSRLNPYLGLSFMAEADGWDAEKMLDLYLHDYLVKKNMHETAKLFRQEAAIEKHSVAIECPQGFLQEWWSIFYDVFSSRQLKYKEHYEAETSSKAQQLEKQSQLLSPGLQQARVNQQRPPQLSNPRDLDSSLRFLENNPLNLSNSLAPSSSFQQQNMNLALHQIKREPGEGSLGRTMPVNPLNSYGQKSIVRVTGPQTAGFSESYDLAPVNAWPLEVASNFQQLEILNSQPEISAQGLSHMPRNLTPTFPGSSAKFNYHNLIQPKTEINGNNRQMIAQTTQTEEHQNQHNMTQQQQQPSRKKKKLSNSRVPEKKSECSKAVENKHVDDAVESFLSHDEENVDNRGTSFRNLSRRSNSSNKNEHKGFSFGEVTCLHSSKSKVLCCDFSSDGKLLASAGHEKKVLIWNMETLDFIRTPEVHSLLITDVRFRPSSTIFATSSFDKTVQIWDSAKPSKSLFKLVGHAEQVLSLDFHPRKPDLLCSCDSNNEMRLWNVSQRTCIHISKGATKQVRFQPRLGKLMATASGNVVNVIDVESDQPQFSLKGHNKEVLSICWDPSGKYIASVSEESARVWSASGGECIHELCSMGNKFQSCTFHPGYSKLLVIGGYQCLELWNPVESNKTLTLEAHRGLISCLADSPQTETVASASHDQCVKIWK